MVLLEPGDIARNHDVAGLDAAMAGADLAVAAVGGGFGIVQEQSDVAVQRRLIALQREDIVPAPIDDLPGDIALAVEGIDGDGRAFERQHRQ